MKQKPKRKPKGRVVPTKRGTPKGRVVPNTPTKRRGPYRAGS